MTNAMIGSIGAALKTEFGERYKIYREEKKQGLTEPCFFIQCLALTERLFFNKRYRRSGQFCIQYLPKDKLHGDQECRAVAERLFDCLGWLGVDGDLVMGTKMRYEVVDGVLHFFVDYDLFIYKGAGSVPVMGEITGETRMKG